ncbi:MAG: 30S ribosomal protein S12 methylthiotransferase RimO [Candidatus Coprenecus sp.]|nr:30S ribosomal protein S12 methylthiotransferase RimO [Candidatus Coprenecus sp.]
MAKAKVITMGCSKNRVDSEHLLAQLEYAGYEISPEEESLEENPVDLLVINTCGFILDAKEESVNAILEAVQAKERGLVRILYVMGCLSQRYGADLKEEIPQVDRFFGAWSIDPILKSLGLKRNPLLDCRRHLTTPRHYAYLKISEGCDRKCSYCAIPGIRGAHTSVPVEALVDEAQFLVDNGAKELIVIAQDTTYYGLDLYGGRKLPDLVRKLTDIRDLEWIRVLYSYPASFPEELLDIMASCDKVCSYIDIPLQHSEDAVLSAMRRSVDGAGTRALVEKMRIKVPGIVIRTTMMVGHPGEGEKEFDALLDFVNDYKIERLGAFAYSEEEGTWGASHLRDAVPPQVKQERLDELMELQADISLAFNESRIGNRERVLVDSLSWQTGYLTARSSKEAPDVDGEVLIGCSDVANPESLVGRFVNVEITGADEYDLYAKIIK